MRKVMVGIIFCLSLITGLAAQESKHYAYTYNMLVQDRAQAVRHFKQLANGSGGFVSFYNDRQIVLKIPAAKRQEMAVELKKTGYVQDYTETSKDLGEIIVTLQTRLNVKERYLAQLCDTLNRAGVNDSVNVEQSIDQAVKAIERLKGQLRYNRHLVDYTEYRIVFNEAVSRDTDSARKSRWNWINRLLIQNLISNK